MIYSVRGTLIFLEPNTAVIEVGGVGFRCRITAMTARQLPSVGAEAMLYTVMSVREDAIELFGFYSKLELNSFNEITTVKGVGPKVGLGILSELSPEKIAIAIATGDFKTLTKAPGVGPKLAQRLVLELKDKYKDIQIDGDFEDSLSSPGGVSASKNVADAVNALVSLGFTAGEASSAIGKLDSTLSTEQLVREGLKQLASK